MHYKILTALTILLSFSLIPTVFAVSDGSSADLSKLPNQLSDALMIPLFAGQILTVIIFLVMFELPVAIWGKGYFPAVIVGFMVLAFCIAVGWLEPWFLLVEGLIVVALLSGKMRDWIAGGGE